MYRKIKKKAGLTLIELLIAILLFSAINGAAVLMLSTGLKIWSSDRDRLDIRQNGNLAMERMVRYLETTNNITAATTGPASITFATDVDNDQVDETATITFDAVNKRIDITIDGTTMILTRDVQSLAFSYYDDSDPSMLLSPLPLNEDQCDSVRVVNISLIMNKGSDTITLNSSAFCRNQGII